MRSPVLIRAVASEVPTTAGMPNSRDDDGRMRRDPARVGDEPGDLREEHDPGRDSSSGRRGSRPPHLVELVERRDEPGDALGDARRRRPSPVIRSAAVGRLAVELLREAPEGVVGEVELRLGGGADPVGRPDGERGLALVPPRRRRASARRTPPGSPSGRGARCSGGRSRPRGRRSRPPRRVARPIATRTSRSARVRPLVDEEVVVGRQRVHPQRQVEGSLQAARGPRPRARRPCSSRIGALEVVLDRLRAPPESRSPSRGSRAPPRRSVPGSRARSGRRTRATRSPSSPNSCWYGRSRSSRNRRPRSEPSSAVHDRGGGVARPNAAPSSESRLDLLLHPPERLDRVPVPIVDRALQAADEPRVDRRP